MCVTKLPKMSRLGYNNEDFLNLLIIYGECNRIISRTCRLFAERYPHLPRPNKNTIHRLLHNCRNNGTFRPQITRIKPKVDNEDNEITTLGFFSAYPTASLHEAARELGISYVTIYRILNKHKWRPYKFYCVQHLKEADLPRRVEFFEWLLIKSQEDATFLDNIIWTDEAKFTKNGVFNRHNSNYWAPTNLHVTRERNFQVKWQFNVFCAIRNDSIFYLEFYDDNLTGSRYANMLRNGLQPVLLNHPQRKNFWYQMDGAPCHNYSLVGDLLTELFEDQWIANNGPFRWPPRTPDGNPLDYFFWGYLKNMVYSDPITTKDDMKRRIRAAINVLTPDTIRKATHDNLLKRINACLRRNGDVFEHVLKKNY